MSPRRNPKIQMKKCAGCGHYVKDGWTNTYFLTGFLNTKSEAWLKWL